MLSRCRNGSLLQVCVLACWWWAVRGRLAYSAAQHNKVQASTKLLPHQCHNMRTLHTGQ